MTNFNQIQISLKLSKISLQKIKSKLNQNIILIYLLMKLNKKIQIPKN